MNKLLLGAAALTVLAGCTSVGLSVGIPIPGGGVSVGVGSDGRVSGGVSVGTGGVSVGIGGTARLPRRDEATSAPDAAASASQPK
jgi:hypothetical protein